MTTADQALAELAKDVADLPHAPACPGLVGCWCPLSDVLDLIQDHRDQLIVA